MKNRVAFTGGGTAGHVFPGLAVYRTLEKSAPDLELYWIGSRKGMEVSILADQGIKNYRIPAGKLRRYFSLRNILDVFNVIGGFFGALFILMIKRPALLFSKGGFVSVPPVMAARVLGIPVFAHESDTSPGLATRLSSKFATKILVSYDETRDHFPSHLRDRIVVTGNPVRSEIVQGDRGAGRSALGLGNDDILLMVVGGSQGALQINLLIQELAPELLKKCRILHQMGRLTYKESELDGYETVEFIGPELPDYLAAADVVISRAGAGSLWELVTLRKPMVLIPLGTGSSRGDQLKNAELLEKRGAARVLSGEVTASDLKAVLDELFDTVEARGKLSVACEGLAQKQGDRAIADLILESLRKESI